MEIYNLICIPGAAWPIGSPHFVQGYLQARNMVDLRSTYYEPIRHRTVPAHTMPRNIQLQGGTQHPHDGGPAGHVHAGHSGI
jgi:hypothetical protein